MTKTPKRALFNIAAYFWNAVVAVTVYTFFNLEGLAVLAVIELSMIADMQSRRWKENDRLTKVSGTIQGYLRPQHEAKQHQGVE